MIAPRIATKKVRRLVVLLIKPTRYDDRGYPLQFRRGVLPTNSLAVMYSLTLSAAQAIGVDVVVRCFDETVWSQRFNPAAAVAQYRDDQTKVVCAFVGVQTNQFPRAADLARAAMRAGATAIIGGWHVSGSIAAMLDGISHADPKRPGIPCPHIMPPEIERIMDEGIIVCTGEAERIWPTILGDILSGQSQPLYRGGKPRIDDKMLPDYQPDFFDDFASSMRTLDTGRGCPFQCSFCVIINVQGRQPRHRNPLAIISLVKAICEREGQAHFFFTDDNFPRNPRWEEILDGLIELRANGDEISFLVQCDLAAFKLPRFVEKLAHAGCTSVFFGMESLRPENLAGAGKVQNKPDDYRQMVALYHQHGIGVHAAYIIGFPADTPQSILEDVETLKAIGVDQASFYILMPLPGSEDHIRLFCDGVWIDPDFNKFDSFRPVTKHPLMTEAELLAAYASCFRNFYRPGHIITSLKKLPKRVRSGMLRNAVWYRNSVFGEGVHPMMCGFWSVRHRLDRRPGLPKESFWRFWRREAAFRLCYLGCLIAELYILQHIYFEVELEPAIRTMVEQKLRHARHFNPETAEVFVHRRIEHLSQELKGLGDWLNRTFRLPPTRQWLNRFWINYGMHKWHLFWRADLHLRMVPHALTEIVYTVRFGLMMLRNFKTLSA